MKRRFCECGEMIDDDYYVVLGTEIYCKYCAEKKSNVFDYDFCPKCGSLNPKWFLVDGSEIFGCNNCTDIIEYR